MIPAAPSGVFPTQANVTESLHVQMAQRTAANNRAVELGSYESRRAMSALRGMRTSQELVECPLMTQSGHRISVSAGSRPGLSNPASSAASNNRSQLRPQSINNSAGDLGRCLVGHWKHRTDVDLAKHVTVGPVGAGRAEHEVRVPDHRQIPPRNVQ